MSVPSSPLPAQTPFPAPISERLGRGDVLSPACPSRQLLSHLTSRWGVLVLIALLPGTLRFGQLRRKVGTVSERMLAQTLQLLEGDGMLIRRAHAVVPPHVDYTLTAQGREAAAKVRELADWVELHYVDSLSQQQSPPAADHAGCDTPRDTVPAHVSMRR